MSTKGSVVWFEVMGEDGGALEAFYGDLFGWTFDHGGPPGYGLVKAGEGGIPGGVGQAPAGPGWLTFYVQVDDLDAAIAKATAQGGEVRMPPMTIDDGRIAVVGDPGGRPIGLIQPAAA